METLEYILKKFNLSSDRHTQMPLYIPDYGRDNLPTLFKELGFKTGAEIGVETGIYSEKLLKNNPDLTLYSIDPWKAYKEYTDNTNQDDIDKLYAETQARLAPYKNSKIIRKFSLDALNDFADNSLDFVYIDGNHNFQSVANDICEWLKKVRPGGIISGHDFMGGKEWMGIQVKQVVIGYTQANGIRPWFVLGTEHKIRGQIRDNSRSWMWVKKQNGYTGLHC